MSLLDTASLIVTPNGYKEGKLYSVIPSDGSGDMSVTRATTATRVKSAGLVELVPYNLLQYSQDTTTWGQNLTPVVTHNAGTAPDGTMTAEQVVVNAYAEGFFNFSAGQVTLGTTYTTSIFVKYISGVNTLFFGNAGLGFTTDNENVFNIENGTVVTQVPNNTCSVEDFGNGWFRLICTKTATANNTGGFIIYGNQSLETQYYVWGAQLVEGSTAKPYQKTETRLNIPRLDYSNGTCPSLLVEPQRTNMCRYSNNLSGADWFNQSANTTLTRIQTGGVFENTTFDRLVTTGSGGQGRYVQTSFLTGSNAVWSVYLRGTGTVELGIYNAGQSSLDTITLTSEWTRYETKITSGSSGYIDWSIYVFGGNTTDVSCAQMEFASYATSYIPTTSASVTRNADVISKTGISSLIGQTEGTLFVDFYNYGNNSTTTGCPICIANGGFYGNAIYIEQYLGNWYAVVWNGSSQQFISSPLSLSVGRHKLALAYKSNDIAFYSDGVLVDTDSSATIPTCDGAYIGAVGTSTTPEQLAVNAASIWKTRLTNTQLAQLTTI